MVSSTRLALTPVTFLPLYSLQLFYASDEETALFNRLHELEFHSFESSPDERVPWIRLYHEDESVLRTIERKLSDALRAPRVVYAQHSTDWTTHFVDYLSPVIVSEGLMVVPYTLAETPFSGKKIIIDPQMVFGSGGHPTTLLTLQFLEEELQSAPHQSLLDLGFGTGVLSIVGSKLGAKRVLGLEIDPACLENAKRNCELNQESGCEFRICELREVSERFDLCCVNILSSVVTALWSDLVDHMNPGGRIIVSGYLTEEKLYHSLGRVRCLKTAEREGWGACVVEVPL